MTDERWGRDIATLRRAAEELAKRRNGLQRHRVLTPFDQIAHSLDDPSADVRKRAVRDLYQLDPDRGRYQLELYIRRFKATHRSWVSPEELEALTQHPSIGPRLEPQEV